MQSFRISKRCSFLRPVFESSQSWLSDTRTAVLACSFGIEVHSGATSKKTIISSGWMVPEFRQEVFRRLDSRWGVQSEGPQVLGQPFSRVIRRDALEGHYRSYGMSPLCKSSAVRKTLASAESEGFIQSNSVFEIAPLFRKLLSFDFMRILLLGGIWRLQFAHAFLRLG